MTHTLIVHGSNSGPLTVVIEPWANEYLIQPNETREIRSNAPFSVSVDDGKLIVYGGDECEHDCDRTN